MIENFSKVESNPFSLEIFARDLRSIYNVFILIFTLFNSDFIYDFPPLIDSIIYDIKICKEVYRRL